MKIIVSCSCNSCSLIVKCRIDILFIRGASAASLSHKLMSDFRFVVVTVGSCILIHNFSIDPRCFHIILLWFGVMFSTAR